MADVQSPARPPHIAVRAVSKSFRLARSTRTVEALSNVSFEVDDDRFIALVGPSGCGKTTLLRLLNGLVLPDKGEVRVAGAAPHPGKDIGFVFQSFRLIPWATIASNIGFGLEMAGVGRAERDERTRHYLDLIGLAQFADAFPAELSGGMKQRVALARALATEPKMLLMDEPFASIDALTREVMQIELMRLWAARKGIVVFVTHSVDEAILLSDQVLLMGPRPGRIVESFEVNLPRPRWDYDVRAQPEFIDLRARLLSRLRGMMTV